MHPLVSQIYAYPAPDSIEIGRVLLFNNLLGEIYWRWITFLPDHCVICVYR